MNPINICIVFMQANKAKKNCGGTIIYNMLQIKVGMVNMWAKIYMHTR